MRPSRRLVLAGAAALAAGGAAPARTAATWIAYRKRLEARRIDAGGGRFDMATGRALLARCNAVREAIGVRPVAWHEELALCARAHAGDLAGRAYVEHLSPEGFDPSDRLSLAARRLLGSTSENIAYHRDPAPATPAQLLAIWRRSPLHWGNLQREHHTHAGVAVMRKGPRTYAVGLFARPQGELAAPLPFFLESAEEATRAVGGRYAHESWEAVAPRSDGPHMYTGREEAPPGVYQLNVERQVDRLQWAVLTGPVFAWRAEDVASSMV